MEKTLDYNNKVIAHLYEEFNNEIEGVEKEVGCWAAEIQNTVTEEFHETEGDIHKDTSWDDYFEWLIGDMQEMDMGPLCQLQIYSIRYTGIDDPEVFKD